MTLLGEEMAKLAIECVKCSFNALNNYCKESVNNFVPLEGKMIKPDDTEFNRLKESRIYKEKEFAFGVKIYWIKTKTKNNEEYLDEKYLLITPGGILDKNSVQIGLDDLSTKETDILPSLFFRVMGDSKCSILPKGNPVDCYKNLKTIIEESKNGIEPVEYIQDYFEEFWVYKIFNDSIVENDIKEYALYCLLLAFSAKNFHLKHNFQLIEYLKKYLIDEKDTQIPLDSLEISMTSQHWKHSFLEAYRAIESLYSIPWAYELKKSLKLENMSAVDIAKHCHKELGWNRKEENSLNKLMEILNKEDSNFLTIFNTDFFTSHIDKASSLKPTCIENCRHNETNQGDKIGKISKLIYKIRNQNVHHFEFATEKIINVSDAHYCELVYILWVLAFRLYKLLHKELLLPTGKNSS